MMSLISSCAMAGVAEWVCCPGELNAPLERALASSPTLHCWQVGDERAAAYFALGRIQATGRAVAVLAGSGSAAAALMPAVVEAYYQRRPLIVVTLDEATPAEGTGAWGRIEQSGLYGLYAAPTVELQLPCSVAELPDMVALCAEGFPIHLHVSCAPGMRRGSALARVAEPPPAAIFRGSLAELAQTLRFRAREEGLLLMLGELDPAEQEPALWLARTLRVPVLADPTSGLREALSPLLLPTQEAVDMLTETPPRYVLRVGSVPAHPFWQTLEELEDCTEVYSLTRTGFSGLRRSSVVMEGNLDQMMRALGEIPHMDDVQELLPRARKHAARLEENLLSQPESAGALVRAFSQYASLAEVVFLGGPAAEQMWSAYAQLQNPVYYIRSVSQAGGVDGELSAFLGNSVGASFSCALLADIARDLSAAELFSQLPEGKRIIAVLRPQPALPELRELARLIGAEYYPIHCDADLEIIDSLPPNALALLELLPTNSTF